MASVAFAPDASTAVTVGGQSAILWDLTKPASPTPLASLSYGTADVSAVAYSPDGTTVATAGGDGELRLWTVADLRAYRTGEVTPAVADTTNLGVPEPVTYAAMTADAGVLLTSGRNQPAQVWDLHDPKAPYLLATMPAPVTQAAFATSPGSPITTMLAVEAGTDPHVSIWGLAGGTRQPLGALVSGTVDVLAMSADARYALTSHEATTTLWDVSLRIDPRRVATISHDHPVTAAAFSQDGTVAVIGHSDGTVASWHVTDLSPPGKGPFLTSSSPVAITSVAVSPDGRTVTAVQDTTTVLVFDLTAKVNEALSSLRPYPDGPTLVSPVGNAGLALIANAADPASLWSTRTSPPQRWLSLPTPQSGQKPVMLSATARAAIVVGDAGAVSVWKFDAVTDVITDPVARACVLTGGIGEQLWRQYAGDGPAYRDPCKPGR